MGRANRHALRRTPQLPPVYRSPHHDSGSERGGKIARRPCVLLSFPPSHNPLSDPFPFSAWVTSNGTGYAQQGFEHADSSGQVWSHASLGVYKLVKDMMHCRDDKTATLACVPLPLRSRFPHFVLTAFLAVAPLLRRIAGLTNRSTLAAPRTLAGSSQQRSATSSLQHPHTSLARSSIGEMAGRGLSSGGRWA